jgi:hypothetical protein
MLSADGRRLRAAVAGTSGLATAIMRALDQAGITVDDAEVRQPSIDDVLFALTGHPSRPADDRPRSPPSALVAASTIRRSASWSIPAPRASIAGSVTPRSAKVASTGPGTAAPPAS